MNCKKQKSSLISNAALEKKLDFLSQQRNLFCMFCDVENTKGDTTIQTIGGSRL